MTTDDELVQLFSYGTLQQPAVQLANFGRELDGRPDALPGYQLRVVEIADPDVIAISRKELLAADEYEVDDYVRILVQLRSGASTWVYIAAGARLRSRLKPLRR